MKEKNVQLQEMEEQLNMKEIDLKSEQEKISSKAKDIKQQLIHII